MDMTGEVHIPASCEVVWAALNNPVILKASIPGCEELTEHSKTNMTAVTVIKIGPISTRFSCAVTLSELDPPNSYRITGEGQGGIAGHGRGDAVVRLTADGAGTTLSYSFSAQVGGKLAQLGGRMIDATAKTISAIFFKNLVQQIVAQQEDNQAQPSATAAAKEVAPPLGTAAAPRPAVRPGPAGPGSNRAERAVAVAALAIAIVAVILAWVRGALVPVYTSAEFNTAVQFLIVLFIGYLLGRSGMDGRNG